MRLTWTASTDTTGVTGYDVADYRTIDPAFGTLGEAEELIAEARELGIRTTVGIVPNHVSDRQAWFRAALAAGSGSPERELFHFRPGRGEHGELPPNDWPSRARPDGCRARSTSGPCPWACRSTGPCCRPAGRWTRTGGCPSTRQCG